MLQQYYSEYLKLKGELKLKEYNSKLNIFLKHTHNQQMSEIRALEAVIKEAQISWSELNRIFVSVSRITKRNKP